ncbi:hypothetical protein A3E49_02045 [Candidatus Saccharibacteria bacterium RIFCSPHIGHO2_12_FULL_49_19]|nr:MAG: hypothetical protein A2708_00585 [Candidatus Saccharibacteria bacterium RIFCSPHIGHO2_01_FULL_49_21]OGL36513.1 MAG: hypothetical protein A3E49_02045 [Candidatus Saccharibacteria bacterium RIFCSPHIGHO2_12_FULL_49_19]OGL38642.1 MAG: hypothetical protein A3B63_01195 [Candidatus Saccharibacteria bacterium RIFCSPLOWO2_01_FULL_49_22]
MVMITRVLKRKDASSVIVAVVVAMIIINFLSVISFDLAARLTNFGNDVKQFEGYPGPFSEWKAIYLQPVIAAVLQLIALEVLLWIYVLLATPFKKKR